MTTPDVTSRLLGYAGLLPFVACGWASVFAESAGESARLALLGYGAVIASFLGGIHWGVAMIRPGKPLLFVWGIVPSLLGWSAQMMPTRAGLYLLATTLVFVLMVDRRLYPRHGLQDWIALRSQLTAVATASCVFAAWAS